MPTLEVKPGISLFYLDSGVPSPPNDTTYMTLFVLHGFAFHSPIFSRAIAISHKYNIRLVAITRRDYPGSSRFTPEDIKTLVEGSTTESLQAFTERAGEIMGFIKEFIAKHDTPPISPDREGGGFSLCGWSLGNLLGFSVLGSGNRFPDLAQKLKPYFRNYILFETSMFTMPPNVYSPVLDESIPKERRHSYLLDWIGSYFTHPPEGLASGDPTLLNQRTPSTTKPSSVSTFTPEERAAIISDESSLRADLPFAKLNWKINESILRNAFIQADTPWPDVSVRSFWGDQTTWGIIFSQRALERWLVEQKEENQDGWVRSYESVCVSGGNHFLHWDQPDRFIETVKRLML